MIFGVRKLKVPGLLFTSSYTFSLLVQHHRLVTDIQTDRHRPYTELA